MKLLDLSFRLKLPLLGALLIVVSALGVSSTLMIAGYGALRDDLRLNSEILGRALAPSLLQDMLHEDTWHAFETVSAPPRKAPDAGPVKAELLIVVDTDLNVFVSSHPRLAPVLVPLHSLGPEFVAVAERIAETDQPDTRTIDLPGSDRLYVLTPIANDRVKVWHPDHHRRQGFLPAALLRHRLARTAGGPAGARVAAADQLVLGAATGVPADAADRTHGRNRQALARQYRPGALPLRRRAGPPVHRL
jgi:hypothetical protein